jgi:peroxiredoxin
VSAPAFTLPELNGGPVTLNSLIAERPALLVFAHGDCPTSALALRSLAGVTPAAATPVLVAEEPPEAAARMARRAGLCAAVLAQEPPYEVSRAYGVDAVPTAVLVDRDGEVRETLVGWDRGAYERLLGVRLPDDGPAVKPGCASRRHYGEEAGGLDELEDMFERGFTDGLPVVPPTPERVEAMLGGRDPAALVGEVPPSHGRATLERVAACAVLAGCRPEYFPVVAAAVDAALDPAVNAHGVGVTTQPAAPIVIVNGPARERIGLNSGMGVLGPGTRANMTIGRALRLVLTLTGGAVPGRLDRSTLGSPGKLGLCIAEAEEESPWEPLHVERGYDRGTSTVTVLAADAPLSISDHRSRTPEELALVLASAAAATWSPFWWPMDDDSLFVVGPEHAALFAAHGWSKARLRDAVFAAAARPAAELRHGETTPHVRAAHDAAVVHKWTDPGRIMFVVAGGEAGRYSAVFGPCDGMGSRSVAREIQWST